MFITLRCFITSPQAPVSQADHYVLLHLITDATLSDHGWLLLDMFQTTPLIFKSL